MLGVDHGAVLECNNGAIKVQRLTYNTSQLIITNTSSLNGSDIECIDHNGTMNSGNFSIPTVQAPSGRCHVYSGPCTHNEVCITNSITESLSLPIDLQLSHVTTGELNFKWNRIVQCSSLRYEIDAIGCGVCPNDTVNSNVTCKDVPINSTGESLCMFAMKAVVCESDHNKTSNIVNVTLKGSAYSKLCYNSYCSTKLIILLV